MNSDLISADGHGSITRPEPTNKLVFLSAFLRLENKIQILRLIKRHLLSVEVNQYLVGLEVFMVVKPINVILGSCDTCHDTAHCA